MLQKLLYLHPLRIQFLSPLLRRRTRGARTGGRVGLVVSQHSAAGLGGCIIALAADDRQAQDLAERLEEKGAVQTWIESL